MFQKGLAAHSLAWIYIGAKRTCSTILLLIIRKS